MTAQQTAYATLIDARKKVMDEVAKANYVDDGTVIAETLPLTSPDLTSFITRYEDDERTRFAEIVRTAYKKDEFMEERSWTLLALWFDKCYLLDWLDRRGGTELIGFDEWKALDTLSEKNGTKPNGAFASLPRTRSPGERKQRPMSPVRDTIPHFTVKRRCAIPAPPASPSPCPRTNGTTPACRVFTISPKTH